MPGLDAYGSRFGCEGDGRRLAACWLYVVARYEGSECWRGVPGV